MKMSTLDNPKSTGFSMDPSDDEGAPVHRTKKRVQQFSDSDSENVQPNENTAVQDDKVQASSDSEAETCIMPFKSSVTKSRIRMGSSSDSDASSRYETVKNEEQQMRIKNKRNKLKDKFKGLLNSRGKHSTLQVSSDKQSSEGSHGENSDPSDGEISSIAKIKQKIKKSMMKMSSICDPDTSDEEGVMNKTEKPKQKQRKQGRSTKLIEPKPVRMSAKQAMENMQLIKSESNRMLREKSVSLPYHRPKALSLKDIMSRRKPAVATDGKALPIKMNEEQLKHYARLLEERQKEMMELCKSESDEELPDTEDKNDVDQETVSDTANIQNENVTETSNIIAESTECEPMDTDMNDGNDIHKTNKLIENVSVETDLTKVVDINSEEPNKETPVDSPKPNVESNDKDEESDKNDSNTDFKLVYNDSVEEEKLDNVGILKEDTIQKVIINENGNELESNSVEQVTTVSTEPESQLISLHYIENNTEEQEVTEKPSALPNEITDKATADDKQDDFFSDDDLNMEDLEKLIENAEIIKDDDNVNSPMLIRDALPLNAKPKLMGAPGMVIDLDGGSMRKKLTGVELLKERFTYFAKLKTPEEIEREKEKRVKPGAQHLKLKQELEEQIAEQRSLEWAKRLEEEKQQHKEMESILDDAEDSFEKIEEKLKEKEAEEVLSSSESEEEEELEENDIEIKDKPRKHNAMVDDEAEESDCDENEDETILNDDEANDDVQDGDDDIEEDDDNNESSDDESSESEAEETTKTKKGRILKAFEDSDDEDTVIKENEKITVSENNKTDDVDAFSISNEIQSASQDDVIQLAQRHASVSDDLFMSQESGAVGEGDKNSDEVLGTQTFSILDSTSGINMDMGLKSPSKLNVLCMSQPYLDPNLNAIVEGSQLPITQTSQSQPIGEDILALCTGKFYDNEFVSQTEEYQYVDNMSQDMIMNKDIPDTQPVKTPVTDAIGKKDNDPVLEKQIELDEENKKVTENSKMVNDVDGNLKFILDELNDPEFDTPKQNKYFNGGNTQKEQIFENTQMKKKFTIDSDDDDAEHVESKQRKNKKLKKRKPEKRALHISDDEDEEELDQVEDDLEDMSDLEEEPERLVEYDSEENEIEVRPDKPKKKRKVADFFEQEAELTSEDEWVGSGDEDEKGLDRMEREAGDDEVFHQGKLRRELGQIHMRDVLDQDKREVRLIQELLFEDGDLGDGHRQRKFRWRNAGDDDETGTVPDEFADTQEEEFESEEQWRKQRHEREVFLRQMQQEEDTDNQNVSVNRTTIIKANLSSKSMSTLLQEVNQSKTETESPVVQEKKTAKDIPSPKKSFSIFQQNYHGSLLTRGRGALARLAALAIPLAADDDAPKIGSLTSHKRNFVFAALTPDDDDEPKVTIKRKAEVNLGTPQLIKKMKIEEKRVRPKSSLLDHLNL